MTDRVPASELKSEETGLSITIVILTFRRLDDLQLVLPSVLQQAAAVGGHRVSVLVVDNDPEGSAGSYVRSVGMPRVRYVNETRPGIAAARNRALAECSQDDVLIFIDDDEHPSAAWLKSLLGAYESSRPAAVVGPVISEYETVPDRWISEGRFFDRRRLPTGTEIDVAATNNLLLDMSVVRATGVTFDEAFGLSGGSDTLFTRTLHARGSRLVWCDEAVVIDRVPAQRLTRAWVLQRAFRSGNSWVRTSLALTGGRRGRALVRLQAAGRGVVRLVGGGLQAVAGLLSASIGRRARGTRTIARGAGMMAGAVGYQHIEYRRPKTVS